MPNLNLHTQLQAHYEAQTLQLKVKADETKLQSEQFAQESSLKLATFNAEFLVYMENINKLQNHQVKHLTAHPELLNYLETAEVYQATHNEFLGKQFSALFNALGSLADAMPANDTLLFEPLNQTLLNAILLTEDLVVYNKNIDTSKFSLKLTALTIAIEKAATFAKNPGNEDNRLALANAADEMMNVVAPGCLSDRTLLYIGMVGAFLLMTAAALVTLSLAVLMPSAIFVIPLCMSVLPLCWGSIISAVALKGNDNRETLTYNVEKPMKKITAPGFFNKQPIALSDVELQQIRGFNHV